MITHAQYTISGTVTAQETQAPIAEIAIYNKSQGLLTKTTANGYYEFTTPATTLTLVFFGQQYTMVEKKITITKDMVINQTLAPLDIALSEVEVTARRSEIFTLKRLQDIEETAIYAGKKTEVVLLEQAMASLASNNARQIYSQVAGLNIYQNDDAGLQLNIGGRGLDPNRTANFNTRQNGYDISADVLGYPESYYTPTAEALEEVQIIRGAASLQYGTQFGGLVNFVLKAPNPNKPFEFITRNTFGSNALYTNFSSVSGTKNKWSYYAFFNYKKGNGFRPNSQFESKNTYAHLGYQFNEKTKVSTEITYQRYLTKQAGGLTNLSFLEDPLQSTRARNWFQVDWLLYRAKLTHYFSKKTTFTLSVFGLRASRYALGFRGNRADQVDPGEERDLIKGEFNNFGFETRILHKYALLGKKAAGLLGIKYYNAKNTNIQGPGSDGANPNFDFQWEDYPNYRNQSNYTYPNLNVAFFGENIVHITDRFSITPGFRFEYINTESDGFFKEITDDAAGNVISEGTTPENDAKKRSFMLLGLGISYKPSDAVECYANASQNYRSVTFSDISTVNPAFAINPDIDDEKGFTTDLGIRGNFKNFVSYDAGIFGLFYNDRIGLVQRQLEDGSVKPERGNVGNAIMYGIESLIDFNINKLLIGNNDFTFNYFINTSLIDSKYTSSQQNGVVGKKVEFVPNINIKTGVRFGYKNLLSNLQYTYLSSQFTDATNAIDDFPSGVLGEIPAYAVLDFSLSYAYKKWKLEAGVNNALDRSYFTRRATGYPGPGLIPSPNRNVYATLQLKL